MLLRLVGSLAAPPLCWSCGGPARRGEPLCRDCRARLLWLGPAYARLEGVTAWAPVAYEGPARELVKALKFRGAAAVADALAAPIVATAPPGLLDEAVLVPVPLHAARRRRRGFSQAERLGAAIAERSGLRCMPCLEHRGRSTPQTGRPRAERLVALRDAVIASAPAPERALLVDDVITTGGTLAACAAALESAGSRTVAAVAYARTLGR